MASILIVEDEPIIQESLKRLLERQDYDPVYLSRSLQTKIQGVSKYILNLD